MFSKQIAYLKLEQSNALEIEGKDWSIQITCIQGVYNKVVI